MKNINLTILALLAMLAVVHAVQASLPSKEEVLVATDISKNESEIQWLLNNQDTLADPEIVQIADHNKDLGVLLLAVSLSDTKEAPLAYKLLHRPAKK